LPYPDSGTWPCGQPADGIPLPAELTAIIARGGTMSTARADRSGRGGAAGLSRPSLRRQSLVMSTKPPYAHHDNHDDDQDGEADVVRHPEEHVVRH